MSVSKIGILVEGVGIWVHLVLILGLCDVTIGEFGCLFTKVTVQLIQKFIGGNILSTLLQEVLTKKAVQGSSLRVGGVDQLVQANILKVAYLVGVVAAFNIDAGRGINVFEELHESKIGSLGLLADFKLISDLLLEHLEVQMPVVTLGYLGFEFVIEKTVLESKLGVALDQGLYLVLVKLCLSIETHHLVLEVVLCVRKLRAELGKFASIAEHLFILIRVAIVHLLRLSLWVDESHNCS